MQKLRQMPVEHPYLRNEWETIIESIRYEEEARGDNWKWYSSLKELFQSRNNIYILFCTVGAQVFGQFSGAGSIAIYAPQLFQTVSGKSSHGKINPSTTVVFGAVKWAASLLSALFFLDRYGRKSVAMTGIVIQTISMLYIAIYLRLCPSDSPETDGKKRGGEAAIVFMYFAGIGWAGGINCIQYILGAEMYGVVVRSLGTMISMAVHFVCQFGSSRAVNPMLDAMNAWGVFLFWAMESVLCFFLVWFFLPETAGYSLEDMQHLFTGPWYKIGWKHNRPCKDHTIQNHQLHDQEKEDAPYAAMEDDKQMSVPVGAIITRDGVGEDIEGIQSLHEPSLNYTNAPQVDLANESADDKKFDGCDAGPDRDIKKD